MVRKLEYERINKPAFWGHDRLFRRRPGRRRLFDQFHGADVFFWLVLRMLELL